MPITRGSTGPNRVAGQDVTILRELAHQARTTAAGHCRKSPRRHGVKSSNAPGRASLPRVIPHRSVLPGVVGRNAGIRTRTGLKHADWHE